MLALGGHLESFTLPALGTGTSPPRPSATAIGVPAEGYERMGLGRVVPFTASSILRLSA